MRHLSTLWAAFGILSVVAAGPEPAAVPFEEIAQLDDGELDKRQYCCTPITVTQTQYITNCYVPPEISTVYITVPTTVYATVEEIITEWETRIETQIRTTSYPDTVGVPINCVPAERTVGTPGYPTGPQPEVCDTITTTEWRTTTVLDFVTSYRPTTIPTTVEVPVPTTIRNTVTSYDTVTDYNTVTDYDTVTDYNTITNAVTDRITTTLPGSTVTRTITTTVPPDTVTVTADGTTITRTIPASTIVVTTTEVLPGETLIITPIFSVTLCPRPTGTGEPFDPASNETWGCKPGYVCEPPKPDGCNFWPEPPTKDFRCRPEHCIVAPPYAEVTWKEDETSYYPPSYGYFNLNPEIFGLSYDIFEFEVYVEKDGYTTRTYTTGNWESQATLTEWPRPSTTTTSTWRYPDALPRNDRRGMHWLRKRAEVSPPKCYDDCNAPGLVAKRLGKVPRLCDEGGEFKSKIRVCELCNEANRNATKETFRENIKPEFAQYLDWCSIQESTPTTTTSAAGGGPESQVESADLTTATQESAANPTFVPRTTTITAEDEDAASTDSIASSTGGSATSEEPSPGLSSTTQPEVSATASTNTEDASGAEGSSISFSAVTVTDADGNISVTSSVVLVPLPGGQSTTVAGSEASTISPPEVIPPPVDTPTASRPGPETPTGPQVVGPTAGASISSASNSMITVTLAAILAAFLT